MSGRPPRPIGRTWVRSKDLLVLRAQRALPALPEPLDPRVQPGPSVPPDQRVQQGHKVPKGLLVRKAYRVRRELPARRVLPAPLDLRGLLALMVRA